MYVTVDQCDERYLLLELTGRKRPSTILRLKKVGAGFSVLGPGSSVIGPGFSVIGPGFSVRGGR